MYRFTVSFDNEMAAHDIVGDLRAYMTEYVPFSDTVPVYKDGLYHYTIDSAIDDQANARIFYNYIYSILQEHSPSYGSVKFEYFPYLPARPYLGPDNIKSYDIDATHVWVNRIDFAFTIDNPHSAWNTYEQILNMIEATPGHYIYDTSNLMTAKPRPQRDNVVYYDGYVDIISAYTVDNVEQFNIMSEEIAELMPEQMVIGTKRISDNR